MATLKKKKKKRKIQGQRLPDQKAPVCTCFSVSVFEEPTRFVIAVNTRFSKGAVRPSAKPDKASRAPGARPFERRRVLDGRRRRTTTPRSLRDAEFQRRHVAGSAVVRPPSPRRRHREQDRRRWSFRAHLASVQVSLWATRGGRVRSLPPLKQRTPDP